VSKLNEANRIANNVNKAVSKDCYEKLSEREIEVAKLMLEGLSNKEIAAELFITQGTVKNYISSIYGKIGVKDRANAVLFFRSHSL